MIHLGNYRAVGLHYIVKCASRALRVEGEIALFIGENGECAAYPYYHEMYERHIRVHRHKLVGVYRNAEACDGVARSLYNQIDEDVAFHVQGLEAAASRTRHAA